MITPAMARPVQFLCMLDAALAFLVVAAVVAELVALALVLWTEPGLLLWSLERGMIARPWMTLPEVSLTVWETAVFVTGTIFPTGAFEMPLSIRAWAPGGTAGRVKLLSKFEAEMRELEHLGGTMEVF
jgi:hypothetical protein